MPPPIPIPERRLLRVYAYDPLFAELQDTIVTLSVPYEPVQPGPVGALVKVVDYDPVRGTWYSPVDLNDPSVLAQQGLAPNEADPRFHQQMVYTVASSVLEHFEAALGRRFHFLRGPIVMYPHAFCDENAYYDGARRAVLFGYFAVDQKSPGTLYPSQVVFTCLSHDIIAHELTHAIVDRLRPRLMDPTNHDVAAFHEAFADLVALFHHFTLPDLVRRHLQTSGSDLSTAGPLIELARQFGEASGLHGALRSGLDTPDPSRLGRTLESHDRGAILVGAVFSAFVETYQNRIADLVRIATGGTGELPPGHLHPDLVGRIADEAITNASRFLTICVRGFDYLPVVDVTFGDFLRAIVTADLTHYPNDGGRKRATLIESFRRHGIYAEGVTSPAESSLAWKEVSDAVSLPFAVGDMVRWAAEDFDIARWRVEAEHLLSRGGADANEGAVLSGTLEYLNDKRDEEQTSLAVRLHAHIAAAAPAFGFHADVNRFKIAVSGFHASFRTGEDGQPRTELVVEVTQERPDLAERAELDGTGVRVFAGTTIVTDAFGATRCLITKPLPERADRPFVGPGGERFQRICDFVSDRDALDFTRPWTNQPNRITNGLSFAQLHRNRMRTTS